MTFPAPLAKRGKTAYNQVMENTQTASDVALLIDSLGQVPEAQAKPALIVVSGLPGTGKSYFCQNLAEREPFLILESDALRKILFPVPTYTAVESARLFQAIHPLIERLLQRGLPLILDATNLSEHLREHLYSIADRLNAKLILVRVEAPPEAVYERLKSRTRGAGAANHSDADWSVYQKMKPGVQKIRRHHYAVDTSRDITLALDKIVREVNR